jgi:pilus assembly protein Flp/PilA
VAVRTIRKLSAAGGASTALERAPVCYIEYNSLHQIQHCPVTIVSAAVVSPQSNLWLCVAEKQEKNAAIFLGVIPMLSIFRRLMKNEHGATAIEYTLIASLIAVAAITAFTTVGHKVSNVMSNVANTMT